MSAGRYAPSPSGELHLGNLRTALLAWLFARSSGREFLLRVENLDRARDSGAAEKQIADLESIGIDWDGEVIYQTDRLDLYASILGSLKERGLTYECFCSRKDILQAVSAPHAPPGSYPGNCRNLGEEELAAARKIKTPAIRIKMPSELTEIEFDDVLRGKTRADVDDFVIRRGDGTFAYNFVVVVDDASTGVDQIVRGDDLLSSTGRQIALQEILDMPRPEYAHVPLVIGPTGARLAKRDGSVTLRQLNEAGVSTGRVREVLLESVGQGSAGQGSAGQGSRRLDAQSFNPDLIPRDPWVWGASAL